MKNVKNVAARAVSGFAIILVAAALLAAACGGSSGGGSSSGGSSGSSSGGSSGSSSSGTSVSLSEFKLTPSSLSAKAGDTVSVQNTGTVAHNLVVADSTGKILAQTSSIAAGASAQLALPSSVTAGSYTIYCSVPGHKQQGMTGTLTVS
jgi:plastocyanin